MGIGLVPKVVASFGDGAHHAPLIKTWYIFEH